MAYMPWSFISFDVKVPVLSKYIVFKRALSMVFYD